MNHRSHDPSWRAPLAAALALALVAELSSQVSVRRPLPDPAAPFTAPLHRSDAPGKPGLWASAATYKVRLSASGMEFVPVLGERAPHNLPLRWRTESIGGNAPSGETGRTVRHSEWRFELHGPGGVVESYDVLAAGVEQSFTLPRLPDLADGAETFDVVGAVDTALRADARGAEHAPIEFRDGDGRTVVSYGAAFAFDAGGRRIELATSFDGGRIAIHVPVPWLREAAYPVVIDPLTARKTAVGSANPAAYCPQVVHEINQGRQLVAYSRAVSASDHDAYARVCDGDFGLLGVIYVDVDAAVSARDVSVAWVKSTDTWLIAVGKLDVGSWSHVEVRIHPTSSLSTAGGQAVVVPGPGSYQDQRPVIGGSIAGGYALVVFERDQGVGQPDTAATTIRGAIVDTNQGTVGFAFPLQSAPGAVDAQRPAVHHCDFPITKWTVAWQERDPQLPTDDWDLKLCRVDYLQNRSAEASLPIDNSNGLHSIQPKLTGAYNYFYLAYLTRIVDNDPAGMTGSRLRVQHVNWPSNVGAPLLSGAADFVVDSAVGNALELHDAARSIAMDTVTHSHFALGWRKYGNVLQAVPTELKVARYGRDPTALETHTLESTTALNVPFGPVSVAFDEDRAGFPLVYGETALSSNRVLGRYLDHPAAEATAYGGSCAGTLHANHRPYAGSQFFFLRVDSATPSTATWLLAAPGPGSLQVPGITNCPILLTLVVPPVIGGQEFTDLQGAARFHLPIPSSAAGVDLYWQAVQLLPGNVLGLSNGLKTEVR